jgi:hypothetical protein
VEFIQRAIYSAQIDVLIRDNPALWGNLHFPLTLLPENTKSCDGGHLAQQGAPVWALSAGALSAWSPPRPPCGAVFWKLALKI